MIMTLHKKDTQSTSRLHELSSGLPSTMRDASGSRAATGSNPVWKASQPTPITVPSNSTRPNPSGLRPKGMNPYSSGRMSDTLHSGYGNATSKATVLGGLGRANKRRKTDHASPVSSSSRFFTPKSTTTRNNRPTTDCAKPNFGSTAPAEVIDLDDEDTGVPVYPRSLANHHDEPSDDEMLLKDSDGSPKTVHDFAKPSPKVSNRKLAPDGEDTKRLQQKIETKGKQKQTAITIDDDDEITEFPEPPKPHYHAASEIPRGLVKRLQDTFDKPSSRSPVRKLDLLSMTGRKPKPGIKGAMKPKSLQPVVSTAQKDVLATSSSFEPVSARKKNTNVKPKQEQLALPLEAWTLGLQMHECPIDRDWLLLDNELKIATGRPQGPVIVKRALQDISRITRSIQHDLVNSPVILKMWFHKSRIKRHDTALFKMGSTAEDGCIALKFLTQHRNFEVSYDKLVRRLDIDGVKCDSFDEHGSKAAWEHTLNAVQFAEQQPLEKTSSAAQSSEHPNDPPNKTDLGRITGPISAPVTRARQKKIQEDAEPEQRFTDGDNLILVYPFSGTGAVNITKADLRRLRPGEFLNDTLIEFGLKLWLEGMRREHPAFADQIHIFNSFFYKKISIRNKEEGYKSVRKWTSKMDLFAKKYIIVPINEHMHWYLAVIRNPEHILLEPPPAESVLMVKPLTRKRKRESEVEIVAALSSEPPPPPPPKADSATSSISRAGLAIKSLVPSKNEIIPDSEEEQETGTQSTKKADDDNDTKEVESMLQRSLSLHDFDSSISNGQRTPSPLTPMEVNDELQYPDSDVMEVDMPTTESATPALTAQALQSHDSLSTLTQTESMPGRLSPEIPTEPPASTSTSISAAIPREVGPIPPSKFYGSSASARVRKTEKTAPDISPIDVDGPVTGGKEEEEEEIADPLEEPGRPKTYIFTFDSLGSDHKAAVRTLSKYLQFEAKDKKGLDNTSEAVGKQAMVPYQPNSCDCGIYVLHFVQRFMSDPEKYTHLILSKNKKDYPSAERDKDWGHEIVRGMRDSLTSRVEELSKEWQKFSEAKQKEAAGSSTVVTSVDSSDDEVIVEDGPWRPSAKKGKGKAKESSALRLR